MQRDWDKTRRRRKKHVIKKLKKTTTQTKILTKKNKEDEQRTIGRLTTFKLQTETTIERSNKNTQRNDEKIITSNKRSLS